MNESGINALLEVIYGSRTGDKPVIFTGTVRSVSPLTVETAGVVLTAGDLLVNARLLQPSELQDPADVLTVGCRVAMVSADLGIFILLCKVVNP